MQYKAIIFDLDGTLLDTLKDLCNSVNRVLEKRGFPLHSMDAYRAFIGDGAKKLVIRSLPTHTRQPDIVQVVFKDFLDDYSQNWNVYTRPYPGVAELLDKLTSVGIKLAVLSNKPHLLTQQCITTLLPEWKFEMILGQKEEIPHKPNPLGANMIADKLGVEACEFVFLGDSSVDMETAIAAGMFPVGALWGFQSSQSLLAGGAKAVIENPIDLARWFTIQ